MPPDQSKDGCQCNTQRWRDAGRPCPPCAEAEFWALHAKCQADPACRNYPLPDQPRPEGRCEGYHIGSIGSRAMQAIRKGKRRERENAIQAPNWEALAKRLKNVDVDVIVERIYKRITGQPSDPSASTSTDQGANV